MTLVVIKIDNLANYKPLLSNEIWYEVNDVLISRIFYKAKWPQ